MPTQRKTAKSARKSAVKSSKSAAKKSAAKSTKQTRGSAAKRGGSSRAPQSPATRSRAGANRAPSSRNRTPNALELLTQDHREVQKMFRKAERMDSGDAQLQQLVQDACAALTLHAKVEEEVFYPALREQGDNEDLVEEATVEHDVAKQLIAQLEGMTGDDERYKATFKVLGEYVNHHIEEEESQMFRAAKRAKIDLAALGEQIATLKQGASDAGATTTGGDSRSGRGSTSGTGSRQSGANSRSSGRGGRSSGANAGADDDDDAMMTGGVTGDTAEDTERPGRGGRGLSASRDSGDDTEIDVEMPGDIDDGARRQAH